ncbi:MAG: hypothetical protein ACOX18_10170 [Bacillota bacterium]|jgi:hypothetical protein
MEELHQVLQALSDFKRANPGAAKAELASWARKSFPLEKLRGTTLKGESFCLRFVDAKGPSLSNTIWSLSALQVQDHNPVVICVCRPDGLQFLLANSTFIRKASHSSHELRMDNVRGSFNGTDIIREINGIENTPENFAALFDLHQEYSWEENLARIVDETNQISAVGQRYEPSGPGLSNIYRSIALSRRLAASSQLRQVEARLAAAADAQRKLIGGRLDLQPQTARRSNRGSDPGTSGRSWPR